MWLLTLIGVLTVGVYALWRIHAALGSIRRQQDLFAHGVVCDTGVCRRPIPALPDASTVAFPEVPDDEPEPQGPVSKWRIVAAVATIVVLLVVAVWAGSRIAVF